MNLIVSGRGVDLDDRLKAYASEKLTRVERFFDRIIKMEVEFLKERNPRVANACRVNVTVQTPIDVHRAHGEGDDHFIAVDAAAHRLEKQLRRLKDRLRDHHKHASSRPEPAPTDEGAEPDLVRMPQQLVKPITPDEARMELDERGLAFLLFTNAETMSAAVMYRRGDDAYGLIEHQG